MKPPFLIALLLCTAGLAGCGGAADEAAQNVSTDMIVADNGAATDVPASRTELVFCDLVKQRIARTDCEDLQAINEDVRQGTAAVNVPNPMTRDRTETVTLVVDRRAPSVIEDIEGAADESEALDAGTADANMTTTDAIDPGTIATADEGPSGAPGSDPDDRPAPTPSQVLEDLPGTTKSFVPKVGRFMTATLGGDGFDITALTPASQEVPDGGNQTWAWSVTPREGGAKTLLLKTIVEGEVGGKRYLLQNTGTPKQVTVNVTTMGQIKDTLDILPGWMKSIEAALIALAGVIAAAVGVWAAIRKARAG